MNLAVTFLTNGNRRKSLEECVSSFLEGCSHRPLDVYIFDNGSTDDTRDYLSSLSDGDGVSWTVEYSETDLGCAVGSNRVAQMARKHKYVLHLESDFFHLPESESGFGREWLSDAIEFMDEGRCDYLYLRRIINEREMFMHWWSQWMVKVDTFGKYMHCPDFWWSNNPHLRRNDAVYEAGVLPLDESKDGPKGTDAWSRPELDAGSPGLAWICKWGIFIHEKKSMGQSLCSKGLASCKYGFVVEDGRFCKVCDIDKGVGDMKNHEERYKCCVTR